MNVSAKRTGARVAIFVGSWLAYCGFKKRTSTPTAEQRKAEYFERYNDAYARLRREDPEAWDHEIDERQLWDRTSGDGALTR